MNHLLSRANRETVVEDSPRHASLLIHVGKGEQGARMTRREPSFDHELLEIVGQTEQAQVVGDV